MCCELDKLFTEVYSGNTTPYGPATFLATMWRASKDLAGYAQQDAHELFISALAQLHRRAHGSTSVSCICFVHVCFEGMLQSDSVCDECGAASSKNEVMLDLSLQLRGATKGATEEETLAGCLRRWARYLRLVGSTTHRELGSLRRKPSSITAVGATRRPRHVAHRNSGSFCSSLSPVSEALINS